MFISNEIQEYVLKTEVLPSFATDHSPVLISISSSNEIKKGSGLWKFNNSLIYDQNYISQTKDLILEIKTNSNSYSNFDDQVKWEFLKYEIRKFTIKYCKEKAKQKRARKEELENSLKTLEKNLDISENQILYQSYRAELEGIYSEIAEGIRVRSKCQWYEEGEKSTKFFLNLEKNNNVRSQIKKVLVNTYEISDQKNILHEIKVHFENLFSKKLSVSSNSCDSFLESVATPYLNNIEKNTCEGDLSDIELYNSLISMKNEKSPGNDGFSKEFFVIFWEDLKETFVDSIKEAKRCKSLSISQRQAVIKLLEKKDKDKRYIENWRPISLLNVDYKIISKALATRVKKVLPSLITSQQTAYIQNRFISETGRLISDILEMSDKLNVGGFIAAMDIEKAFDSLDHTFLVSVLKKFGFGDDLIDWVTILIRNQESCVINAGVTSSYFQLQRGARQGDPISPYLFILALETLFISIKNNVNINGINIFDHNFIYTAYADDTTFFLKDKKSIKEMINEFQAFSYFSGLKPNFTKSKIAGIGSLKSVQVAVCGIKEIDLRKETLKIVGIHFSYNKQKQNEKNFYETIKDIERILNIWKTRKLTLEGKVNIFKTLAISKLVYLVLIADVPRDIVDHVIRIQENFLWYNSNPKIKTETICLDFKHCGLRNANVQKKIISLQISWIKKLYDNYFH